MPSDYLLASAALLCAAMLMDATVSGLRMLRKLQRSTKPGPSGE